MDEEFESEEFNEREEFDEEVIDEEGVEVGIEPDIDEADVVDVAAAAAPVEEEEEVPLLEEEEPDSDEVEASLDQILEERVGVRVGLGDDEEDEDFEDAFPAEDRSTAVGLAPKKPGEFTCRSCFLVKHPSQLADAKRVLCRDCV